MIRLHIPAALLLALLSACSKSVITPIDDTPQSAPIPCISVRAHNGLDDPLQVIRSEGEYQAMQRALRDTAERCADSTFPAIDFSRYTLLGTITTGGGCWLTAPVSRMSIVRDAVAKSVLWKIVHIQQGSCKPLNHITSWIIVPAIPADHTVSVAVETEVE